jgi:hypothetical protein
LESILRIVTIPIGFALVGGTLFSAMQTFVVPRSSQDKLTRVVFLIVRAFFLLLLKTVKTYAGRDRIMAFYAPVALLMLVPAWYLVILIGYMLMFWGLGVPTWLEAFRDSGSSLLTLGFAVIEGVPRIALAFSEAAIGLIMVALLIAYLPTMYAAFARREVAVSLLEVRAGNPPSAAEMLPRYFRIHGLDRLTEVWRTWETWFADIEESHTSLPALVFFRSPQPDHSWVTSAGAVLDAAALMQSTVEFPNDAQAALCIRAGFLALRRIADTFGVAYNDNPARGDPISISRAEYDQVVRVLKKAGIPIKADREEAWLDFTGWRVNYDTVLLALARITMAPPAPWTGSRERIYHLPELLFRRRKN